MDIKKQTKLTFKGVDIVGLNCKVLDIVDPKGEININIKPSLFIPEEDGGLFNIIMEIDLRQPDRFELSLTGIGNFEFIESLSQTEREGLINVNAPAIMFPYIRSFISTLTSNMGGQLGMLTIPPQFFQGVIPKFTPPKEN